MKLTGMIFINNSIDINILQRHGSMRREETVVDNSMEVFEI